MSPKTVRYRVLHVATVLAHRGRDLIVHLDESWPWVSELATAFTRLRVYAWRSHSRPAVHRPDPEAHLLSVRCAEFDSIGSFLHRAGVSPSETEGRYSLGASPPLAIPPNLADTPSPLGGLNLVATVPVPPPSVSERPPASNPEYRGHQLALDARGKSGMPPIKSARPIEAGDDTALRGRGVSTWRRVCRYWPGVAPLARNRVTLHLLEPPSTCLSQK